VEEKMPEREIKLINELRKDSRSSLTALSMKLGIPITTTYKVLKRIEKNRLVTKHVTLMDFAKLGYALKLGIFLKASDKDKLKAFLKNHENLNTLQRISGDCDFFAEMIFADMAECYNFIDETEKLTTKKGTESHYFLNAIREEAFMAPMELV
jgi:Lrp/AsnC family leucine-responsive transcriptional regulator